MPQGLRKKFSIVGYFRIIGFFEILARYLYIDGSHWRREDVQWIIYKVFRENFVI